MLMKLYRIGSIMLFVLILCQREMVLAGDLSLFKEIVTNKSKINSLESHISQIVSTDGGIPQVFKGRYRADGAGRFRIDYYKPEAQIVINNGKNLYWYYPKDKILYNMGAGNSGSAPQIDPYDEFSQNLEKRFRVKYIGNRLYGIAKKAGLFLLKDRLKGVKIYLWIDRDRKVLLKKVVTDKNGRELIKEIYGNYKKINRIYFPMKVDVTVRTAGGITRNITDYSNVRLNLKFDSTVFFMNFPADAVKKNFNEK